MALNSLVSSRYWKSIAQVAGGNMIAQGIAFGATPVLTRVYVPDHFGVLGQFVSLSAILIGISALRYELTIPMSKTTEESLRSVKAALVILAASTVLVLASTIVYVLLFGADYYWIFLSLSIATGGVYQIFTYWAIYRKEYRGLGSTKIWQSASQATVQIGLGSLSLGVSGLIVGQIFGQGAGVRHLARSWYQTKANYQPFSWSQIRSHIASKVSFSSKVSAQTLVNQVGLQSPVIILTALYGAKVVGYYVLANKVIGISARLVGRATSSVFIGEVSGLDRKVDIQKLLFKTSSRLVLIGVIPILTISFCAPYFFPIVFGFQWAESGEYALILGIPALIQFGVSPTGQLLNLLDRSGYQLIFDVFRLAMMMSVLAICIKFQVGATGALIGISIVTCVYYISSFVASYLSVPNDQAG